MTQQNSPAQPPANQSPLPAGDEQPPMPATALQTLATEQAARLKKAADDLLSTQTDLILARQQTQQNSEYLQAVLNHSPAAIGFVKAVFDTLDPLHGDPLTDRIIEYRLMAVNDKFARLVGEPIYELVGQPASRVAGMLWQGDTYAVFYRIITENATLSEERDYDDETGQRRWASISATKHDGGVVLTSLDSTELRQTQLQCEALRRQVSQSDQVAVQLATLRQQVSEQGESMRVATHNLRSSLGVIQGAAQLLNIAESDDERAELMEMLNRNVQDLTRLLTELIETTPDG